MKKYQATPGYLPSIEAYDVERETLSSVWIDGTRAHKSNPRESYHDTFEQAKHYLISLAMAEFEGQSIKLQRCKHALERAINIKDIE